MKNFKNKETKLHSAIEKVNDALFKFSNGSRLDVENWNNYHDLHDRLVDRLKDNLFDYQTYLFEKNGFVSISI